MKISRVFRRPYYLCKCFNNFSLYNYANIASVKVAKVSDKKGFEPNIHEVRFENKM